MHHVISADLLGGEEEGPGSAQPGLRLEQLRTAIDAHSIVSATDARGTILRVNDKFCTVTGYSRDELLGQNQRILKSGVHPPEFYARMWQTIAGGRIWHGELCNRRKDGTLFWVESTIVPFRDDTGEPLEYISILTDITILKQRELALRESEIRFVFAVEGAGDGVWDWDIQTGTMQLSGNYEGMLGYAKGEMQPTLDAWVASVHPDDLPGIKAVLDNYLAGALPAYAVELRLRCKDGSYKWVLCRGTVMTRDAAGQPLRMIGIHSDISERKAAEFALVEAREAADRANQAKSDFLSSMSHELRTPMNAIIGFAQMLEYDQQLNADQQDNVHEILKAGRHLLDLINEVLDLAKIESGRISLSMEPVLLAPLFEDCRHLIQPMAVQHDVQLMIAPVGEAAVFADRVRLKQVLLNLLSNAAKYNRSGGEIRLTVQAADGHLRIAVADTGAGIAAARLSELFQPFNRLDAERNAIEGTGIGLTITRRLVELMGGEIGVDSTVGVGTTFWLTLQASGREKVDVGMTAGGATYAAGRSVPAACVLCIDDNPANLKLVTQMLGMRQNLRLITAHKPELGIELALAHRPDLILLDINMPGMDGYQVLEIFKADPVLRATPVIAVTANAMPRDIERGLAAGFADYLTKPLEIDHFLHVIDGYLVPGGSP
jgi:PAS domain S-box-containing protein